MGASVRATLAIDITVAAIVIVAVAQILYWKLVITAQDVTRRDAAREQIPDMDWLREPVEPWVGLEADDAGPALVGEPVLAGV
jgi:hypothetical protein